MNLKNNPSKVELSALFAECDDKEGHHILWVDTDGNVAIDMLENGSNPGYWAKQRENQIQFRLETWVAGNGYTGLKASKNSNWIDRIFEAVTTHWQKGTRGYIDSF